MYTYIDIYIYVGKCSKKEKIEKPTFYLCIRYKFPSSYFCKIGFFIKKNVFILFAFLCFLIFLIY